MIEAHELTKRFGRTLAVDQLSFVVRPGRVTGFLGPNGAGKSTTMRMILGLDSPTSGAVTVRGRRYQTLIRPLHQVGALLDANAVHGGRTALEHLRWIARSNGIGDSRVREVLAIAGIEQVARKRVGGFSLGMKQRLGIASALLGDPPVLLFDEPINGLDPDGIRWIRTLLSSLAAQGRTVLVSSHLMSEMAITADHVLVIGRGRLIADASMADFVQSGSFAEVLVRTPAATDLSRLLTEAGAVALPQADGGLVIRQMPARQISDLAAAHGVPIYELTPRHGSLEDAYLRLADFSTEYRAQTASSPQKAAEP